MLKRAAKRMRVGVDRFLPDAFIFVIILTLIVLIVGMIVALDERGNPLIPAISWMDRRAGSTEIDALTKGKEPDYHYKHTGWRLTNSFNLVQIKYLQHHSPEIFSRTDKFLSTSDYINFRLTGRFVTDYTSAGITNMERILDCCWDKEALKDLSVGEEQLSDLRPSGEEVGTITEEAAKELGLPAHTLVINGAQDQYCGSIGSGAINDGDVMLAGGTAWVMLGTFAAPIFDTQGYMAPCPHVLPGQYGAMATIPTGGVAMEWFRETFHDNTASLVSYEALAHEIEDVGPGADGLLFYPHFSGATCPDWKIRNRSGFLGIHLGHKRAHFARAVMEGVVFDAAKILRAFRRNGVNVQRIRMIGGAAKSDLWCGITADVADVPVIRMSCSDAPCAGAAIIAGVGCGMFGSYEEAVRIFCKQKDVIEPDTERHRIYEQLEETYENGFRHLTAFYEERLDTNGE